MKAVLLDRLSLDHNDLDFTALRQAVNVLDIHHTTRPEQVTARIAGYDMVITNKVVLNASILAQTGALKLICVTATGTNNIDIPTAQRKGIQVCNVRGYGTSSVVQHVFMLILALRRRLFEYRQAVQEERWQKSEHFALLDYPMQDLSGQTLGVIGHGELGKAVAEMGRCFGMQVVVAQRPGGAPRSGRVSLDELLARADVVSLHCPLTEQTHHLLGPAEFAKMKPTALLINAARGGIVEEQALLDALQLGLIAGAGVDVLSEEPPRAGNLLLDVQLPNLIVTPHIAWASRAARQRLLDGVAENILAYTSGQPINLVSG